jgi:DNA polymerase elongation subunit (family B)
MTKFYTDVCRRGNYIFRRGYEKGLRVADKIPYSPYVFIPKDNGKHRTIDGKPVEKLQFDSMADAKDFLQRYEDVSNMEIYGLTLFEYLYVFDEYKGDIDYDPKMVKVGILDIECAADDGFPDIQRADKPLTAITIRCRGRNYVFGCGEYSSRDDNTHYIQCKNEHELIQQFLDCWQKLDLDIVSGWNIEFFDIPYLVNRIKLLFDEPTAKKLSPWRMMDEKFVEFRGKSNQSYNIIGLAALDYYQLYRKFTFGNQESYKLDYICQVELGEKKIDYSEYGNLLELYKQDFQKFIEYNIHDTVLVDRLDEKMKFIEQVMAMAYDAKVNYDDTLTTVRSWDVIIHNYLLERNIVIPKIRKQEMTEALVGGYVKEPKIGLSNWVVSFDLNSLYPHLIMQYNISPETFAGRLTIDPVDKLLEGSFNIMHDDLSYAANGCVYRKDKQGFLPALMEKMYNDRTKFKKLMLEAKQRYENKKNAEDEKLIARYHNMQMAKKIQLNSAYGALGNQYFRWFNFDHAEAITMSGQLSIRWIEAKINQFMNNLLKTDDHDYVIASDTDSIYVEMDKLVQQLPSNDVKVIVNAIDKFCENKVQPFIDKSYQELADYMNAYQQKMQMKRETIADKGIWRGKKMYILNAWNVEGVQYNEPKLKLQGIEAVRSSTPHACRENIKKALGIILNGNESELIKFVEDFRVNFLTLPFEEVSFPRGVKHMKKYTQTKGQLYDKGTPIHVKAALVFNDLIKKHNMTNVQPITDGDKIRFAYLKSPNPIGDTVIGAPDTLPEEFNMDKYIDRELQFTKSFLDPVNSIASIIGWKTEQIATLEDFFS